MRDTRFVAEHRGGPLTKEQHFQLIQWAVDCAEHVLPLSGDTTDERLKHALRVAEDWRSGNASVGDARKLQSLHMLWHENLQTRLQSQLPDQSGMLLPLLIWLTMH